MENLTQTELSELKDKIELFKESEIWQHILSYMQSIYATCAEDALNEKADIAVVRWNGGVTHAIKMISTFDDNIPLFKKAKESE